jgi:hypothetical protein
VFEAPCMRFEVKDEYADYADQQGLGY